MQAQTETTGQAISLQLPAPIARYFAADKVDGEAVSDCFVSDAVVQDEGHSYIGIAAIKDWKDATSAQFQYTVQPLSLQERDGKTVVNGHLTGTFPGGSVNLRYIFALQGDKIASLEILP